MISGRIATSMSSSSLSPASRVGLIALAGMEIELGRLLGHKAELHTFKGLHPLFRQEVLDRAEVQYEQTR